MVYQRRFDQLHGIPLLISRYHSLLGQEGRGEVYDGSFPL